MKAYVLKTENKQKKQDANGKTKQSRITKGRSVE